MLYFAVLGGQWLLLFTIYFLNQLILGAFTPTIFCLIFKFIFKFILGFKVINPSYIPFLIGLKITYKLVPKSTLSNKI